MLIYSTHTSRWRHLLKKCALFSISVTLPPPQTDPSRIVTCSVGPGRKVVRWQYHITRKWVCWFSTHHGSTSYFESDPPTDPPEHRTMMSSHDSHATPINEHAYHSPNTTSIRRNRHFGAGDLTITLSLTLSICWKSSWISGNCC